MKKILISTTLFLSIVYSAQTWNTTGNSGTNPTTNFIGTTDNQPLVLKANNKEGLRILSDGNVRIGGNIDPITNTSSLRIYSRSLIKTPF